MILSATYVAAETNNAIAADTAPTPMRQGIVYCSVSGKGGGSYRWMPILKSSQWTSGVESSDSGLRGEHVYLEKKFRQPKKEKEERTRPSMGGGGGEEKTMWVMYKAMCPGFFFSPSPISTRVGRKGLIPLTAFSGPSVFHAHRVRLSLFSAAAAAPSVAAAPCARGSGFPLDLLLLPAPPRWCSEGQVASPAAAR